MSVEIDILRDELKQLRQELGALRGEMNAALATMHKARVDAWGAIAAAARHAEALRDELDQLHEHVRQLHAPPPASPAISRLKKKRIDRQREAAVPQQTS